MKATYEKAKAGAEDQEHVRLQVQQLNASIEDTEKRAASYVESMKDLISTIEMNVFLPKLSASMTPEIEAILRKKQELKTALESQYSIEDIENITNMVLDYLKEFA